MHAGKCPPKTTLSAAVKSSMAQRLPLVSCDTHAPNGCAQTSDLHQWHVDVAKHRAQQVGYLQQQQPLAGRAAGYSLEQVVAGGHQG